LDDQRRKLYDRALSEADADVASRVRTAILEVEHVSLAKRFRDFALEHVSDKFFRADASKVEYPVGRSDLVAALQTAYRLRSKHIHTLQELPPQLVMGGPTSEVSRIDGMTYLTFQGLSRLARHVVTEFVARQPKTDVEPYNYEGERAGIVTVPLAAQYWIWRPETLTKRSGGERLEGLLEQVTAHLQGQPGAAISDLSAMLEKAETLLPQMTDVERRPFLALYIIFNSIAPMEKRSSNNTSIRAKYAPEFGAPSIEALLTLVILGMTPEWPLQQHEEIHNTYFSERNRKNGIRTTRELEAALSLDLAERHRSAGNIERARALISFAVENFPGRESLAQLETNFSERTPIAWQGAVFSGVTTSPLSPESPPSSDSL